jgi:hypothetical protein
MLRVFISHSSKRDRLATRVREHIAETLRKHGYQVLVDVDVLQPGQEWRPALYHWMADCDIAVVLLNADAVESPWVQREVNILMWRRALNRTLPVFPVMIGDMRSDMLKAKGFGDILEVQAVRDDPALPEDVYAAALCDQLLARFANVSPAEHADDLMRRWLDIVASLLERADRPEHWLPGAARALGVRDDAMRQAEAHVGGSTYLAHQMLEAKGVDALRDAVGEVAGYLDSDSLGRLVRQLLPVWINPDAARHVLSPDGFDRPHVTCLNAVDAETAGQYVDRAMCAHVARYTFRCSGGLPFGEDAEDDLFRQCLEAVRGLVSALRGTPPEQFRPRPKHLHCLSIDVRGQNARVAAAVVQRLLHLFPWLNVVLLTGARHASDAHQALWGITRPIPPLQEDEEALGYQLTQDLRDLPHRLNGMGR